MRLDRIHIPRRVRYLLKPLGWVFGEMVRLRRWCYRVGLLRAQKAQVPTICVGNIAVGGTGKTPHVEYVISQLQDAHHPALLSRGYGRTSKGYVFAPNVPEHQLSATLIGDEPLLLHTVYPDIPLAVDGDRVKGIRQLCLDAPHTDVVVLDDAFQHLSLKADLNIVLTEYSWPYFVDYPMPAGRLREFPAAIQDADMVVVTKTTATPDKIRKEEWRQQLGLREDQPLFFTSYQYRKPLPVTDAAQHYAGKKIQKIVLVTGIGNSQPLVDYLQQYYTLTEHVKYPDHHAYTQMDIEQLSVTAAASDSAILTTEKDWMRMQDEVLKKNVSSLPIFIIPISVQFLFEEEQTIFNQIIQGLC